MPLIDVIYNSDPDRDLEFKLTRIGDSELWKFELFKVVRSEKIRLICQFIVI